MDRAAASKGKHENNLISSMRRELAGVPGMLQAMYERFSHSGKIMYLIVMFEQQPSLHIPVTPKQSISIF